MITIDICDDQEVLPIDESRIRRAIERILTDASYRKAQISVAIVDDATMRDLNQEFLGHDYATDVLSFLLEDGDEGLEGEIIVSAEFARGSAPRFGWPAEDELLLYVVHGALHLVGHDDQTSGDQEIMRERERHYLGEFGLRPSYEDRA